MTTPSQPRPDRPTAVAFVDPTCPFAWITSRWLVEVAGHTELDLRLELMSLSVVNEGRELDGWYRAYNDGAWRPARVAAALLASDAAAAWPRFYGTFGTRRHVDGLRDDDANLAATLADLGLPDGLLAAADDEAWDDDLRRRTETACGPLGRENGGTPLVHLDGRVWFGPVLTAVPRGDEAVRLFDGFAAMSSVGAFSELKGVRSEDLHPA